MKKYLPYIVLGIGFIMILVIIYTSLYNNLLNSTNNVFEANNTTIQLLLLITSIITILFLAINFKQQKDQIDKNIKDVEFNRCLDITFKQVDNTIMLLKSNDEIIEKLNYSLNHSDITDFMGYFDLFRELTDTLFKEINFYYVLLKKTRLTQSEKINIFHIVDQNLSPNFQKLLRSPINNMNNTIDENENFDEYFSLAYFNYILSREYDLKQDFNSGKFTYEGYVKENQNEIEINKDSFLNIMFRLNYIKMYCLLLTIEFKNNSNNIINRRIFNYPKYMGIR